MRSRGHGRGGRLGVDDAKVHDGDVAALTPTPVPFPLSARVHKHFVVRVAAGKHHTLAVTRRGAVFSWGRGADGRLGYDARDADGDPKPTPSGSPETTSRDDAYQRTPRLVAGALRDAFAIDVAAANRHSAVVTRAGEVFAFGSNAFGQLGTRERARARRRATRATRHSANAELCFSQNVSSSERERGAPSFGSSSSHGSPVSSPKPPPVFEAFLRGRSEAAAASASNGTGPERTNGPCEWSPKEADALKPLSRVFVAVSASKQHTLVLDASGAVYQFGQGDHSPRRVDLKNSEKRSKTLLFFRRFRKRSRRRAPRAPTSRSRARATARFGVGSPKTRTCGRSVSPGSEPRTTRRRSPSRLARADARWSPPSGTRTSATRPSFLSTRAMLSKRKKDALETVSALRRCRFGARRACAASTPCASARRTRSRRRR